MSLGVVEGSELRRRLVESGDGSEDGAATLPLVTDDSSHLQRC